MKTCFSLCIAIAIACCAVQIQAQPLSQAHLPCIFDQASQLHFTITQGKIAPASSKAFSWTMETTDISADPGTYPVINGFVKNLTDSNLYISFRRNQTLPDSGWTTSVCFGTLCYAWFVDTEKYEFTPGESLEFSFHVTLPDTAKGAAVTYLRLSALTGNPADSIEIKFTVTANALSSVAPLKHGTLAGLTLYPNPVRTANPLNLSFTLKSDANVSVGLYDVLGRKSYTKSLGHLTQGVQSIKMNTLQLPEGTYLVKVNANGQDVATGRLISIK